MTLEAHLDARERARTGALPAASATAELRATLDEALTALGARLPTDTLLLAVGGTGLGRVGALTDVDLAVVSAKRLAPADVRPVLLPLWDAGLKVGHSVRTVAEAAKAAKEDTTIACALLTRRRLAGDAGVEAKLDRALGRALSRPGAHIEQVVGEERSRRVADPYGSTRPDLKHGRGGLRTIDAIRWVTALSAGRTVAATLEGLDELEATLVEVRHAVHGAAGARRDLLDSELLVPVAARLDRSPRELARQVLETMDRVEALADETLPDLAPVWAPTDDEPTRRPLGRTMLAAVEATRSGLPLREATPDPWSAADRDTFRWLLRSMPGREVVQRLRRLGWLDRAVPELGAVWLEPHLVPFHSHPVGGHSLRTFAELQADPAFGALGPEEQEVLEWAALFHDIGKGAGGDHSEVGARRFDAAAARLRIPAARSSRARRLIRHHLLLADMGTRLDPDDPDVRRWAAAEVGDLETLHLLSILTAADSRATGTDTWNAWRRSLIEQATAAIEAQLRGVNLSGPVLVHLVRATGRPEAEIVHHLAGMPDAYRTGNPVGRIARHVALLDGEGLRWKATERSGHTEVALVAPDRPGLVAQVAGALALHRCSVVDARCNSHDDGLAVDTFVVIDGLGGPPPDGARIDAAMADVLEAWSGDLDLDAAVAGKAHDYRSRVSGGVETAVDVRRRDPLVEITVECADRVGLLHDLAATIHRHGGSIERARLDTVAGLAHDVFEVSGVTDARALGDELRAVAEPMH